MSSVKVKVSEVSHTTIQSSQGKDLNYVVLKGYDDTNSKGFSKRFFATKQDGMPTKNAEVADTLQANDWVEVTMDNTSYKNVTGIERISEPSGGSAPDQTTYKSAGNTGTKGSSRDAGMLNRASALDLAIKAIATSDNGPIGTKTIIQIADRFEDYITNGIPTPSMTMGTKKEEPKPEPQPELEDANMPSDDEIPF
jgi:hypothetical protein